MKKKITISRSLFVTMIIACAFSLASSAYFVSQVAAKEDHSSDRYASLKIFTDVLAIVEKNYVEPVNLKDLVEGAVKGMLLTLDPHSSYMDSSTYKELQVETQGKFGGLGIEITIKDGILTVVSPIEDSPAARVGIKPGDQIIKIGREFAKDLSLVDAVKKMRGPKGTSVKISVHREGRKSLIPFTVVRDDIKVKSVRSRILENGYGYVRLAQFQDGSTKEFKEALKSITEKSVNGQIKGLVLDLRNNPGGLLNEAVRVSDLFLKDGVVVYTEGRLESQKQKYFAHDDKNEPEYPIVILVNGGSASASEIVSGSMQDSARALIVGEQTFGKGSVQTVLPMEQGDALRLTTALYFTKSGRSIQAQGVTPDIKVETPKQKEEELIEEEEMEARESNLPGAFKNPNAKDEKQEAEEEVKKKGPEPLRVGSREAMEAKLDELLKVDTQLAEALKFLKEWDNYRGKIGEGMPKEQTAAKSE